MTTSKRWFWGLLGALGCASALGCGDETDPVGGMPTPTSTGTASGTPSGTHTGTGATGGTGGTGGARPFTIIDVPTTDCASLSATPARRKSRKGPGGVAPDPVGHLPGQVHDVPVDQEEAREVVVLHQAELFLQAPFGFGAFFPGFPLGRGVAPLPGAPMCG